MSDRLLQLVDDWKREVINSNQITKQFNKSAKIIANLTSKINRIHEKEINTHFNNNTSLQLNESMAEIIVQKVCKKTGITKEEIFSKSRKREIYEARFQCIYWCRRQGMTLKQVGKIFKMNHSSIIHAVKKAEEYNLV